MLTQWKAINWGQWVTYVDELSINQWMFCELIHTIPVNKTSTGLSSDHRIMNSNYYMYTQWLVFFFIMWILHTIMLSLNMVTLIEVWIHSFTVTITLLSISDIQGCFKTCGQMIWDHSIPWSLYSTIYYNTFIIRQIVL